MIESYLNQIVKKNVTKGYDLYGEQEKANPIHISCRIQSSSKKFYSIAGVEFTADAEMWTKPNESINTDDLITWEQNTYRIIRIDDKRGVSGMGNHKKAYLVLTKNGT